LSVVLLLLFKHNFFRLGWIDNEGDFTFFNWTILATLLHLFLGWAWVLSVARMSLKKPIYWTDKKFNKNDEILVAMTSHLLICYRLKCLMFTRCNKFQLKFSRMTFDASKLFSICSYIEIETLVTMFVMQLNDDHN
jgi:hypothetical protein